MTARMEQTNPANPVAKMTGLGKGRKACVLKAINRTKAMLVLAAHLPAEVLGFITIFIIPSSVHVLSMK